MLRVTLKKIPFTGFLRYALVVCIDFNVKLPYASHYKHYSILSYVDDSG